MRQLKLWMLAAILMLCGTMMFTSCSNEDNEVVERPEVNGPRVISQYHVDDAKMTVFVIEYPSSDPFGKPVTLSGTITVGDEVNADNPGLGLVLYNHHTVYKANQCPSKGNLDVQKFIAGSGLITISADYYGFGSTEDKQQAYCISAVNAQASVDALLAAKKLLPTLGYSWNDDILFNTGYSQGGQTSIAVVRLIDEKYPDLHITYTFAGGGSYDIPETYRQFIQSGVSGMPSTVISVLLAYNEYFSLGIPRERIFLEPTLSHIDEWILSKQYTLQEIDAKVGSQEIASFATPELLDLESDLSKRYIVALEKDNLCKGWKPRKDEHIMLVHHTKDITVPVANTENLEKFLREQGVENLTVYVGDYGSLVNQPAHESGAIIMATNALGVICNILGIKVWFNISDLNFF